MIRYPTEQTHSMTTNFGFNAAAITVLLLAAGCGDATTTELVNPSLQYELYAVVGTNGPATKTMLDRNTGKNVVVQVPPVFTQVDIAALEVTQCDHDQCCIVAVPTAAGLARLKTAAASGQLGVAFYSSDLHRQFRFRPDESGRFTLSGHPAGRFGSSALPRVIDAR